MSSSSESHGTHDKLTEIRRAVLIAVRDKPDQFNPTNTGRRSLLWLAQNGLIETTTSNPTAAQVFRITPAGRRALESKEPGNG